MMHTFECGQCFRWDKTDNGEYIGVVGEDLLVVKWDNGVFEIDGAKPDIIEKYFDLNRNYSEIKKSLSKKDDILPDAIKLGYGIRILRQDPWEALVSFIISANNNIPRIKKIINSLCVNFGNKMNSDGNEYYTFPKASVLTQITEEELGIIKSGFRAKYILDAAKKVANGEIILDSVYNMNTDEAEKYLMQIKGVGKKVADCVLLFAYGKYDVFPKDVWIKKVLNELYGVEDKDFDSFVINHFGEIAGFAQQYLFYYMRG